MSLAGPAGVTVVTKFLSLTALSRNELISFTLDVVGIKGDPQEGMN